MSMDPDSKRIFTQVVVMLLTAGAGALIGVLVTQSSFGGAQTEMHAAINQRLTKLEVVTAGLPAVYTIIPTTLGIETRVTKAEERIMSQGERVAKAEAMQELMFLRLRMGEVK